MENLDFYQNAYSDLKFTSIKVLQSQQQVLKMSDLASLTDVKP